MITMDGSIIKAFLTLAGSVGVLGFLLYLVKKAGLKAKKNNGAYNLEILSKLTLQPKSHIFIIKAESKILMVGVSEKSINLISDLTETNEINTKLLPTPKHEKIIASSKNKKINDVDDLSFKAFLRSTLLKTN
jgi:flagellar biogenesis protein FliO